MCLAKLFHTYLSVFYISLAFHLQMRAIETLKHNMYTHGRSYVNVRQKQYNTVKQINKL